MKRNVLVVSANGGVGSAVTRTLLDHDDRVIATVSRPEKMAAFRGEFPGCEKILSLDLAASDCIGEVIASAMAGIENLDAVIVCGAVSPFAPMEMTALDVFRNTMEINCVSHLAIYQAVMPLLRKTRGRLIFTGSLSGRVATPMMGAYVASKFALEGLTDTMRQEASEWGVEVILLQPGNIDTPIVRNSSEKLAATIPCLPENENALYGHLYRQMAYRVDEALAAGNMMKPEKVGEAALAALDAEIPETRYRLGPDAEFLIEASRTRTDREIDAIVLDIYRSAPI